MYYNNGCIEHAGIVPSGYHNGVLSGYGGEGDSKPTIVSKLVT